MIGSGATLGRFTARLGMDSSGYAKGMLTANAMSHVFGTTFAAFVANPLLGGVALFQGIATGAITAGKAMVKFASETLEGAEAIERLSQQTGVSVELLQSLQKRLEIAGFDAEKAGTGLKVFTRTIAEARQEGSPFAAILDELNVNFRDMDSLDAVFNGVMEGLYGIEDAGRRAYLASKLLGEEDSFSIVNAIGGGSAAVKDMLDQYRRMGAILDRDVIASFAEMNTHLGITKQSIDAIKQNAMNEFLIGLAGGIDLTDDKIIGIAESINAQLAPSMRELGRTVPPLVEDLVPLVSVLTDLLDLVLRLTDKFGDFETGGAAFLDKLVPGQPFRSGQEFFGTSSPLVMYGRAQQFKEDPGAYIANRFSQLD